MLLVAVAGRLSLLGIDYVLFVMTASHSSVDYATAVGFFCVIVLTTHTLLGDVNIDQSSSISITHGQNGTALHKVLRTAVFNHGRLYY